jgi:hypothetical protein
MSMEHRDRERTYEARLRTPSLHHVLPVLGKRLFYLTDIRLLRLSMDPIKRTLPGETCFWLLDCVSVPNLRRPSDICDWVFLRGILFQQVTPIAIIIFNRNNVSNSNRKFIIIELSQEPLDF